MTSKQLRCFLVGCNNEHNSHHLLPSSERLKRILFVSERNAASICLNASMFPNNVLISKFHDECG